jgi:hypothetical protein
VRGAIERYLYLAIESVIDIGNEIISALQLRRPEQYRDIPHILVNFNMPSSVDSIEIKVIDYVVVENIKASMMEAKSYIESFLKKDTLTDLDREVGNSFINTRKFQLEILTAEFLKNKFDKANFLMELKGMIAGHIFSRLPEMSELAVIKLLELLGELTEVDYDHLYKMLNPESGIGQPAQSISINQQIQTIGATGDHRLISDANQFMVNLYEILKARQAIENKSSSEPGGDQGTV